MINKKEYNTKLVFSESGCVNESIKNIVNIDNLSHKNSLAVKVMDGFLNKIGRLNSRNFINFEPSKLEFNSSKEILELIEKHFDECNFTVFNFLKENDLIDLADKLSIPIKLGKNIDSKEGAITRKSYTNNKLYKYIEINTNSNFTKDESNFKRLLIHEILHFYLDNSTIYFSDTKNDQGLENIVVTSGLSVTDIESDTYEFTEINEVFIEILTFSIFKTGAKKFNR